MPEMSQMTYAEMSDAERKKTLHQLDQLKEIAVSGYTVPGFTKSVQKLVDMQREAIERDAHEMEERLKTFEKQYGITSAEFLRQYEAGKMGDSADVIEWVAYYKMFDHAQNRLSLLQKP